MHRMTRHALTQTDFDCLLDWLDPNRAKAGEKYEGIRRGLIEIFNYKGCLCSEELADETIDRVARRVPDIRANYEGDKAKYFYGVGRNVYREYLNRKRTAELPKLLIAPEPDDVEQEYYCLDQCIGKLTVGNRTLVLRYYSERKQAKIDSRRAILKMLNLKPSALRVRVFRIRETLEKCVRNCLELCG